MCGSGIPASGDEFDALASTIDIDDSLESTSICVEPISPAEDIRSNSEAAVGFSAYSTVLNVVTDVEPVTTTYQWPPVTDATPVTTKGQSSYMRDSTGSPGDLCVVCGDRASGFHYNAYTCEGCKGFFRRSIIRQVTYACKYGGNCEMDTWMRRRCPACRLRRCLEVGMKQECLVISERRKSKERTHRRSDTSSLKSRRSSTHSSSDPHEEYTSPLELLNDQQKELIEQIVTYQEIYEVPSESDILAFSGLQLNDDCIPDDMSSAMFTHMTQMTMLTTHLVVEFAKRLPGFLELGKDDQIVLLKGSASEVMQLRTARRYNPQLDEVIFGDGTPITRDTLCIGGLPRAYVDDMFDFAIHMSKLAVDNAEYALLTSICIFSDRPGLVGLQEVDRCRDRYSEALVAYNRYRRPNDRGYLARLLMMLVELRTLSCRHAQVLRLVKVERGQLPTLLSEYFDLFE